MRPKGEGVRMQQQATQQIVSRSGIALGRLQSSVVNARQRFLNPGPLVQGKNAFEVIWQEDIIRLRYYPP